jgi:prepilin-type N-terminal cleavage/methylation domain-containing protein
VSIISGVTIKEMTQGEKGFSLIELLVALTLMALLGALLLPIISIGSSAYNRMINDKNALSEARIAMSYITVKLRQKDISGAIGVVGSDSMINTRNVLKIDETPDDVNDDSCFIYFEENEGGAGGRLVEKYSNTPGVGGNKAEAGAYRAGNVIADINDFAISYADGSNNKIDIEVRYSSGNSEKSLKTTIAIKSEMR